MENDVHSTDSTKTINGKYTYFRTVELVKSGKFDNHFRITIYKRFKAR